ncbi:MFS general substrate transporter [Sporormia fimetaria CBS 119925]|uniref:MFS general substrate transporter n=1 Tax=Sporormia fimetaria CBS 119925 TaxID=1340428 RepID=A0A6A6V8F1_9PLEO|nr:MFS general substrate transporter [Sporormia fimetaria CBS 119925]
MTASPNTSEDSSDKADAPDGHLRSWKLVVVISSLCLGIFLHGLDTNIMRVAIPQITTQFKSLPDIAWYGSSYLLAVTAFQPFLWNSVQVLRCQNLGSVVCAAAPNSAALIAGRSVLGLGAAGLLQGALAFIGYSVQLEKVPLYQGIVVSAFGISVCSGPVIGGALTDRTTWRCNVPTGIAVIVAIFTFVRIKPKTNQVNLTLPIAEKLKHIDSFGIVLFIGSICCLLLILQLGGQDVPWNSAKSIGLFSAFGWLMVGFCLLQWRLGEHATIPLRILRLRSIHMGALILFFLGLSSMTYAYFLPVYFQSIQGVSATKSGVRFISLVCPQIVGLVVVGAIVSKWGFYVPIIIVGIVITSVGAGLLITLDTSTPTVKWATYMVINGLGIGMAQQLPYTALQAVLNALGIAIAQNVFINELIRAVSRQTAEVAPQAVIAACTTGITHLTQFPEVILALRRAYVQAIRQALIVALVGACGGFPFAWCMEWLNIKKVAEARRGETAS